MSKFPNVLAAVEAREKHLAEADGRDLWKLGEALIRDCGSPRRNGDTTGSNYHDNSHARVEACSELLAQKGYAEYSLKWLLDIRETCAAFPRDRRYNELAFFVHKEAGNPDILDWVVKNPPKKGDGEPGKYKGISGRYVRDMVSLWRERHNEQRQRELEKAQTKKSVARTKEEREEADEEIRRHRSPPPRRELPPPEDNRETPILQLELSLQSTLQQSLALAKDASRQIGEITKQIDPDAAAALLEVALKTANAWRDVADAMRKKTSNIRGHLSVVA